MNGNKCLSNVDTCWKMIMINYVLSHASMERHGE